MKMFYNIIVVFMFVCYLFGIDMAINTDKNEVAQSITKNAEPCVLQDCCMHDGEWYIYDTPCVFDEEACEIMSEIFADKINAPIAAVAEYKDGYYLIHLN